MFYVVILVLGVDAYMCECEWLSLILGSNHESEYLIWYNWIQVHNLKFLHWSGIPIWYSRILFVNSRSSFIFPTSDIRANGIVLKVDDNGHFRNWSGDYPFHR